MRYSFRDVKNFIEKESDCKLLDDEYTTCKQNLNLLCRCGSSFNVTFDNFKNKNKRQCNECTIKNKRIKTEDVTNYINENVIGYSLIEIKYKEHRGYKKPYLYLSCSNKNHKDYWACWGKFKNGQRCSQCFLDKKLNNPLKWDKKSILYLLESFNLKIIDESYEFVNAKKKIKCINEDGYYVDALINSLKQGRIPSPFYKNKYAVENLQTLCNTYNLKLKSGQKWKGVKRRYEVSDSDGYEYLIIPDVLLRGGKPRIFHVSNPHSISNIRNYCHINKLDYEIVSNKYTKRSEPLLFKYIGKDIEIEEDQRYFYISMDSFINGTRHPIFSQSKGENEVRNYLIKNGLTFIEQYSFMECRNKRVLPFDFAILNEKEEVSFLIEYDGIQHFEVVDYFGGEEGFKQRKFHDSIKDEYCYINNIKLIRIPYWNVDRIEEILGVFSDYGKEKNS